MPIDVTIKGFRGFRQALEDPRLLREMRDSVNRIGAVAERAIKLNAPVDTGRLRNSVGMISRLSGLQATVATNVKYARPVNDGSVPHFPPVAALNPWARRHGIPAFLVARAISRRGTKATKFFTNGVEKAQQFAGVEIRDLGRAIVRILATRRS
jgi:hypothetical protein